jgi:hypothetical protein
MKRKRSRLDDPQTQTRALAMTAMVIASLWWLVSLYLIWTAAGINANSLMFYALLLLLLSVGVTIGSWGSQRQPLQGAMVSLAGGIGMLILSAAALNAVLFWALQPSNLLILAAAALMYALPYLIVGGLQLRLHRSLRQIAAEEALLPAAEAATDTYTKLALDDASLARDSLTAHTLSSDSERTQRARR